MTVKTLGPSPGAGRNPEHRITIAEAHGRWTVAVDGVRVADSRRVLALDEEGYERVLYFPSEDVAVAELAASETRTRCPFKGEARYYSMAGEGGRQDVAWYYPAVYDEVAPIAGRVAFYADRAHIEKTSGGV